ncbi:lysozyme inhibitor LprI family protein [Stenotrophomonas sp.]|uniref:lysozyme inhibitor LprI family protein n=1 Tax=Stenotrophomonas sp. TaxID=69392 RepID=UPI0028A1365D|nr:lysozyme inhibitor LprI family protein [Stenotrophomonas sp.]
MKRPAMLFALALSIALAAPAPAQAKKPATPAAPARTTDGMACDSPNQSQAGLNQCAGITARSADAELNRVYAQVLAANAQDKAFLDKLKASQRAWVAFRDAQIAARYPSPADYGSVLPMCQSGEYEQLTRDRVEQLKVWVAGVEEGDVCAGSYPMRK